MITIGPTPIILDIILIVPIWDGAVIGGINSTPITISIGVIIDQVIITRSTIMAINEAINGIVMVNTVGTVNDRVTTHANGDGKLIIMTDGMGKGN
jgi:hypothetical protein